MFFFLPRDSKLGGQRLAFGLGRVGVHVIDGGVERLHVGPALVQRLCNSNAFHSLVRFAGDGVVSIVFKQMSVHFLQLLQIFRVILCDSLLSAGVSAFDLPASHACADVVHRISHHHLSQNGTTR